MNHRCPTMTKVESVYKSDSLSVTFITAEYTSAYSEIDFNAYPTISFPVISCFDYEAGSTKFLLDTNQVLFEKGQTEFKVSKYPIFNKDATLSIQFLKPNEEIHNCFSKLNQHVSVQRRNIEIEILLRKLLSAAFNNNEALKEQLLIDIINSVPFNNFQNWIPEKSNHYTIKHIDESKDFIHTHYHENLRITDIASISCLSPFHFSRMFRLITGYAPYDYLLKTRIENAKLLLEKDIPVTQTAFSCGFNSLDNFSYTFNKVAGSSPSSFKKSKISKGKLIHL